MLLRLLWGLVRLIRALQRAYPNLKITWITSRLAYSILEGLSGTQFIVIDKPHSLSSYLTVRQQVRGKSYDVLLAAQASLRANLIYPLIKAPRKIGFDRQRARDAHGMFVNERVGFAREHLMDGFMRFAKTLGVTDTSLVWDLPITEVQRDWAKEQLSIKSGPWLAVNPMASKSERNWLISRYVELIDRAAEQWKLNVVLTGGPGADEKAMSAAIADKTKTDCLVLTGKTNLKQMAALLAEADALVAPDTGPVHIATAMNTPVIGLYAVAPPELSGPYLSQSLVVNKYPDAVASILKENPETVAWGKRVHSPEAMALIAVDNVMEKLREVF